MKKYLLITSTLLLLFSCMKEKGTYDIINLEYITVDSMLVTRVDVDTTMIYLSESNTTTPTINAEVGENLIIEPFITYNEQNKEEDMVYNWRVYLNLDTVQDTISNDKNLDIIVSKNTGEYWFFLNVENEKTGIKYKVEMDLNIAGGTSGGVLFLSELDGQANVGLLNTVNVFKEDVYQSANDGKTVGTNPVWINYANVPQAAWMANINIFCDDGTGGCSVNYITLRKDKNYSDLFFVTPDIIKPEAFYSAALSSSSTRWEFIINNGRLHVRDTWYASYYPEQEILFKPEYTGDYYMNKYALVGVNYHVFYDDLYKRFWRVQVSGIESAKYLTSINTQPDNAEAIEAFDPDDVGLDMIYTYRGADNMAYSIMADPADHSKLYRLKMNIYGSHYASATYGQYVSYWKKDVTTATNIQNAKAFAMSRTDPYLFYADGSKIYRYDLEYDLNIEILDVSSLIDGKDADVDVLYFANSRFVSSSNSTNLYVAFSEVGGTGKCGSVARLKINRSGEIYTYEDLNPDSEDGVEGEDDNAVEPIIVFKDVIGKAVSATYKN